MQGARAVELDVRTHGDEVIVRHDASKQPLSALREEGVPTLAEVLAWAAEHHVAVNVEMKHDVPDRLALARACSRVIAQTQVDVLLSSFDPTLLAMAATLAPRLPRALLVHSRQARWADALQALARRPAFEAIHLERTQTDPRTIARHVARGLRVGVWTVNDPVEARDLVALGVATIITDHAGPMVEALKA